MLAYYNRAWALEDQLWQSLVGEAPFYLNPDPLRNLLIFYLGHTAVFYINKLMRVGLVQAPLHAAYEDLFAVGVDPEKPDDIAGKFAQLRRADLASVWGYRQTVYDWVADLIDRADFTAPVTPQQPLWALIMAIEHPDRVERLVLSNVVAYDSWPIDDMIALGNPNWRSKSPRDVADFVAGGLPELHGFGARRQVRAPLPDVVDPLQNEIGRAHV